MHWIWFTSENSFLWAQEFLFSAIIRQQLQNCQILCSFCRTLRIFFAQVFLKYHGPNHLARLWCAYCVELSGLAEPTWI